MVALGEGGEHTKHEPRTIHVNTGQLLPLCLIRAHRRTLTQTSNNFGLIFQVPAKGGGQEVIVIEVPYMYLNGICSQKRCGPTAEIAIL